MSNDYMRYKMKKITAYILLTIIISMNFLPSVAIAESNMNEFDIPFQQCVDIDLFEDVFVSYNDYANNMYWATGKTYETEASYLESVYAYKGLKYNTSAQKEAYPSSKTKTTDIVAFLADKTGTTKWNNIVSVKDNEAITADDINPNRYYVNVDDTKYHLGEISSNGKGKNAFVIGSIYDVTTANDIIKNELNSIQTIYQDAGTTTAVNKAVYSIENTVNVKTVNLLMSNLTQLWQAKVGESITDTIPVTIKYDDDTTERVHVLVGSAYKGIETAIYLSDSESSFNSSELQNGTFANLDTASNKNVNLLYSGKMIRFYENGNEYKYLLPSAQMTLAACGRMHYFGVENSSYYGPGYVYSYKIPVNAAKNVKTITVEHGYYVDGKTTGADRYPEGITETSNGSCRALIPLHFNEWDNDAYIYTHSYSKDARTALFAMTLEGYSVNEVLNLLSVELEKERPGKAVLKKYYDILESYDNFDFDQHLSKEVREKLEYYIGEQFVEKIYVSPCGNDEGKGTESRPFKTIEKAQSLAREYIKNGEKPMVILTEGTYKIQKAISLNKEDAGTTYAAQSNAIITSCEKIPFSAFKKIDDNVDVKEKVKNKIYQVNLDELSVDAGEIPEYYGTSIGGDGFDDVEIFVNGVLQPVAQYPDGESNYATRQKVVSENTFLVDSNYAKHWNSEKNAYFEGFMSKDYRVERNNISINNSEITFKNKISLELKDGYSQRYKIKHVLYELDKPGEWYIDRDTNVLYIYPTELCKADGIEISFRKNNIFELASGANNITFQGITIEKIRGSAITGKGEIDNINIKDCTFSNISNKAVNLIYTARGTKAGKQLTSNFANGATNCTINGNKFIGIGSNAVELSGGTRETLTAANNVVSDNYIYDSSRNFKNTSAISILGMGNIVENNEIHGIVFLAINFGGNENKVRFNEIYNVMREVGDSGAIYSGRRMTAYGDEVSYNFIHHFGKLDKRTTDNTVGIYLDDRLSGASIHHNIVYPDAVERNGNGIQINGGHFNDVKYNVIVDANESITLSTGRINMNLSTSGSYIVHEAAYITGETITADDGSKIIPTGNDDGLFLKTYPELAESFQTLINPNETVKSFLEKYPDVRYDYKNGEEIYNAVNTGKELDEYKLLSMRVPLKNEFAYNLTTSSTRAMEEGEYIYSKYDSEFVENNYNADKTVFIDPDKLDFRIKSNSTAYKEGMLNESFELNSIGLVNNTKPDGKEFLLTYPEKNANMCKSDLFFMWEKPIKGDYYILEIADNAQMDNAVSYETEFNWLELENIPFDAPEYYWRVTAKNISKEGEEWYSNISKFKGMYDIEIIENSHYFTFFNVAKDYNHSYFNNIGEVNTTNITTCYNLEKFKTHISDEGYLKFKDTVYYMPQKFSDNIKDKLMISSKVLGTPYTYYLSENERDSYSELAFAISGLCPIEDYKINLHYQDGSTESVLTEIGLHYSEYYNNQDVVESIFEDTGVNRYGETYSQNNVYSVKIPANPGKVLTSVEFTDTGTVMRESSLNGIILFAITGIQASENGVMIHNCGEEKQVKLIFTGNVDGNTKVSIQSLTLKNNEHYRNVELPEKLHLANDLKVFIWDSQWNLNPLSEKIYK